MASWHPEGTLTKSISENISAKTGKPWLRRSIAIYRGKNKETDEPRYEYVSFFVKSEDIDTFRALPPKTKIRLHGEPEASAYIKDGEAIGQLQLRPGFDEWFEIIEKPEPKVEDYDDEPF